MGNCASSASTSQSEASCGSCGDAIVHRHRTGHLPHESHDVPGVDGLLHRADTHRPRAVRAGATRPSPPLNRPPGDHRTSHHRMDGATGHRGLSERHRAAMALARSRCHLRGRIPAPCRQHGHHGGHHLAKDNTQRRQRSGTLQRPAARSRPPSNAP